jgi:hypothetical protein
MIADGIAVCVLAALIGAMWWATRRSNRQAEKYQAASLARRRLIAGTYDYGPGAPTKTRRPVGPARQLTDAEIADYADIGAHDAAVYLAGVHKRTAWTRTSHNPEGNAHT